MRARDGMTFAGLVLAALFIAAYVVGGAYGRASGEAIAPEAAAGVQVWQRYGCEDCHTLYGQGGHYAPDLTHIVALRGDEYIREFIVNPSAFHPGQRVMPRFTLTQTETQNLLAMLNQVDAETVAADDFPPRLINVAGASFASSGSSTAAGAEGNPILELGRTIFSQRCASCHSISPNVTIVGPSLAGIPSRAAERVAGQSADAYIRNSILNPSAYVVEGFPDVMQKNFADVVSSREIDALITFLMTLEG
jgi:nitric oxide reductase subunit C